MRGLKARSCLHGQRPDGAEMHEPRPGHGGWKLRTDLLDLLRPFTDIIDDAPRARARNILVEGPAGCGKTTLVHNTVRELGVPLLEISSDVLSCRSAEEVEEGLISLFSEAESKAPCVIFLDDIDHWLPKSLRKPAQYHLLSHLQEFLFDLREYTKATSTPAAAPAPAPVAFIATSRFRTEVHPAFSAFTQHPTIPLDVVQVHPLGESERASIFRSNLDEVSEDEIEALIIRTPGYVAVDMARLLLEARRYSRSRSGSERFITVNDLTAALPLVRPLLLDVHGERWSFSSAGDVDTTPTSKLYGLEYAEKTIQATLAAAFSRASHKELEAMGHVRGLIVHGCSGSGKSALLARAIRSLPRGTVHVLRVDSVDVVSSIVGEAERALTQLFAAVRAAAPTLLILENLHLLAPSRDDLDADRADGASSAAAFERILATLLVEIDGVRQERKPVMMLASTPKLDLVEPAMLRPGRFELHVRTTLPDDDARRVLFERALTSKLPEHVGRAVIEDEELMQHLVDFSTAYTAPDIWSVVNEAVFRILRDCGVSADPTKWTTVLIGSRLRDELRQYIRVTTQQQRR